jgi:hypothetical protein
MASRRACLDPRLRGDDRTRDEDGSSPFLELNGSALPHVIPAQAGIQPTEHVMQARERCVVTIMASRRACLDPRLLGDDRT